MAKKLFKRFMPSPEVIQKNPSLKHFSHFLNDPNLWHLNRYSVSTAISIGFFICFLPFPGHTIVVLFAALLFRANLPLTIAAVWASNPFTMGPMYYFAYIVGTHILNVPTEPFHIELSFHWLAHELKLYYEPLLLGSVICGTIFALLGNIMVRLYWRFTVVMAMRERAKKRKNSKNVDIHTK